MNKEIYKSDLRVPRYTSYPTAPNFHAGITDLDYCQWLKNMEPERPVSLYIHIPFCKQLCWFCGCNTKATNSYGSVEKYLDLLETEINLIAKKVKSPNIEHIHFGGGSPTIIGPEDFLDLVNHIRHNFNVSNNAEIAIEIDPRTVSEEKIRAYVEAGVNRASIGIQDFNHKVQENINRIQPFDMVSYVVKMLNEYGISNINADLIYGLPKQDIYALLETINLTLSLDPKRIALFGYAHVPWMKKHQQLIDESALPNLQARFNMMEMASNALQKAGYVCIGLDHFAKKDDSLVKAMKKKELRRNFQGYTTDSSDTLIGVGISSISSLPEGYIQNATSPVDYSKSVKAGKLPACKGIEISDEDRMRREIISSIMCYLKVDLKQFDMDFSREILALEPLQKQGVVSVDDYLVKITPSNRNALRVIASVFDTYLKEVDKKHSLAV